MLAKLLEQDHRQQAGLLAAGDHMELRWRLADLLKSRRELLADILITFHAVRIDSSVSVIVSPRLRSRLPPQQTNGRSWHDRSFTRQMFGNGLRAGRLRVNVVTAVVFATALPAAISSSVAELSVPRTATRSDRKPRRPFRTRSIEFTGQLLVRSCWCAISAWSSEAFARATASSLHA